MIVYVAQTDALGDFLNCFPVLSGINKSHGKYDLIIKKGCRQFKGIRDLLLYQDMFSSVYFDDEVNVQEHDVIYMCNWDYREDTENPNRPRETAKYDNWLKDNVKWLKYDVDDSAELKFPEFNIQVKDTYVGDRWDRPTTDKRRRSNILSDLTNFEFLNYDDDILLNCYKIKKSKNPFITNLTGVGILADLLKKESYIVWKPEDFDEQYRKNNDVVWANGKNIEQVFSLHYYLDRKCKLVHSNELKDII